MAKRVGKEPDIPAGVEHWPDCTLCPKLCDNSMNVCLEGEGPSNAKLMILGEAPGQREDDMNRPFIGQAGEYLRDELLVDAEVPESKIRISNATRCHPPKNRNPTIREIKNCRRYLEAEIKRIKPRVIVGMGNVPLASILRFYYKAPPEEGTAKKSEAKVSGISKWQGKKIWLQEFQCWFIPTFHPSYAMRNERSHSVYSRNLIVKDLKRAWKLAQAELPEYKIPDTEVVRDTDRALRVIEMMKLAGRYAFDIETGGVGRATQKYVIGVSLSCSSDAGYYIPFSRRYYDDWEVDLEVPGEDPEVERALRGLLNNPRLYKIMHNGAYELRILRTAGVPINARYFDTMVGAHLLDENFNKGLKDLTWVHAKFGGYDTPLEAYKDEHRIKEDYGKIPPHLLEPYAALDAVATWILYEKQSKELRHEGFLPLFEKIVMPVRRVMSDAEHHGIRVDDGQAELVRDVGMKALGRLEERIFECAGGEFPLTNKGIAKVLYDQMGFTPLKETKTGYSVDKESIDYVATQPDSDIAKYLSDRSYVSTMLGTHISQALAFRWPEDGRVHTNYNVTGAGTGRTSASHPSLQNVPQDSLVRSVYTASEGCYLVEGDLKSAELAVIGALAGEETFIDAFNNGLDPHSVTYRRIYGLPSDYTPTKLERRMAKCFHPDTEVLTPNGWVKMRDLNGEPIMQAWLKGTDESVEFEWTSEYTCPLEKNTHDRLVHLNNEGMDLTVTPDHRMVVQKSAASKEWSVVTPYEVEKSRCWPNAGVLREGKSKDTDIVRLAMAIQADGSLARSRVRFGFTKARKVERLQRLLDRIGVEYRLERKEHWKTPMWYFTIQRDAVVDSAVELLDGKVLSWRLLSLGEAEREAVIEESSFWDSHTRGNWSMFRYTSAIRQNVDVLQAVATSVGRKTRIAYCAGLWNLSVKRKSVTRGGHLSLEEVPYTDSVALLSVPSTFVLVRDGGIPVVTGQTINFGLVYGLTAIGLARRLDMTVEGAQAFMDLYFQRLPNVYKWMEKQRALVRKQGYVESVFHRRRRLPLGLSDKWGDQGRADRQAMNAPVQSTAADYTYIGLIRLDRNIRRSHLESKIVHTVHDCGVTDTPVAEKEKMIELFHVSFETPVKVVPVRMRVDVEVNRRWGEGNESRLKEIVEKVGLTI